MEISFSEAKIRDLCCCREALVQMYGLELAKKICNRLGLLAAASSVSDLPSSPPISLVIVDGTGIYSVALGHTHQLFFKAIMPAGRRAKAPAKLEIQTIGPVPVPATKGKRS